MERHSVFIWNRNKPILKIYMESQGTPSIQNNLEKEKKLEVS